MIFNRKILLLILLMPSLIVVHLAQAQQNPCRVMPIGESSVFIRAEPSTHADIVGRILPHLFYDATERTQIGDDYWYRVRDGWVAGFVTVQDGDCAALDITPTATNTATVSPVQPTLPPPTHTVTATPPPPTFTATPPPPTFTATPPPSTFTATPPPPTFTATPFVTLTFTPTLVPEVTSTSSVDFSQEISTADAEALADAIINTFTDKPFLTVDSMEFAEAVQDALPESHIYKQIHLADLSSFITTTLICSDNEHTPPDTEPIRCGVFSRMSNQDLQALILVLQVVFYRDFQASVDSLQFAQSVRELLGENHPARSATPEVLSLLIQQLLRCEGEDANINCDPVVRESESSNPSMNARALVSVVQQIRADEGGVPFDAEKLREKILALAAG